MARCITFFLSALAALNVHIFVTTASPLRPQIQVQNVVASTTTTSVEATVTDVVTVFNSHRPVPTPTSASEETVTRWDTTTVTAYATESSGNAPSATPASWILPEIFQDLSPLMINKLAYGSQNIQVVSGIPASASASSTSPSAASVGPPSPAATPLPRPWTNASSAYRIFYPSGSINPRNRPQGGSDFYATPGNLAFKTANNVTLEYSVFFPADFEWVRGGKLPGLYGGHEGCSGGNSAESCFSTRLMWREGGAGELYLYAPKDKQTQELCNAPPQSVCDAAYGLSVSRGSFHFAAGGWTHVSQTVRLNTPGKQDGGFELLVNKQRVMRRDDVFYRDIPQRDDGDDGQEIGGEHGIWRRVLQVFGYDVPPPLLRVTHRPEDISESETPGEGAPLFRPSAVPWSTLGGQNPTSGPSKPQQGIKEVTLTTTTTSASPIAPPTTAAQFPALAQVAFQSESNAPVGFSGLFFSTFFGGHEQLWASPKDQYTWFKDFGMSINA